MQTIKVNLKSRSYNIIVGTDITHKIGDEVRKLKLGTDAYIITNRQIQKICGAKIACALKDKGINVRFKIVPEGEKSKSFAQTTRIIQDIADYDIKKKIFIVALGGGVVGDLAGFAASLYKRGIPYIQIPTTLLAQVDSAIGGKTAVDLKEGKNLLGAFYQPRLVFSDTRMLKSLSPRQVRSGMAEVIKYAVIKDEKLFAYLEKHITQALKLKTKPLEHIIARCSKIKADIVSTDEREEKGVRTVLNFGHTIGHAIETASYYQRYSHGEAIALGMLSACDLSLSLGLIKEQTKTKIYNIIAKAHLPLKIKGVPENAIIKAHYRDKKFIGPKNRFVLITEIGRTKIVQNVTLETIKEAVNNRF